MQSKQAWWYKPVLQHWGTAAGKESVYQVFSPELGNMGLQLITPVHKLLFGVNIKPYEQMLNWVDYYFIPSTCNAQILKVFG